MPEKVLPTIARYTTKGVVFRRFTLKERFKILFGFSMIVDVTIASQHSPGQTRPFTAVHLTPETNGNLALARYREKIAKEADANKAKMEGGR